MIVQNPTHENHNGCGYCAIRKRKPDGSPNVGKGWLEPFGSTTEFVDDQKTWEVVFYTIDDIKNLPE